MTAMCGCDKQPYMAVIHCHVWLCITTLCSFDTQRCIAVYHSYMLSDLNSRYQICCYANIPTLGERFYCSKIMNVYTLWQVFLQSTFYDSVITVAKIG